VYGTVVGAGVLSAVSTVGAELYLRSVDRTKELATSAPWNTTQGRGSPTRTSELTSGQFDLAPTEEIDVLADGGTSAGAASSRRRVPWRPLAIGSVAAFALAMAAITGFEAMTGSTLSGGEGNTLAKVVRGEGEGSDGDGGATIDDGSSQDPSDGASPSQTPGDTPGQDETTGDEIADEPTGEPTDEAEEDDEGDTDEPTESPSDAPTSEPTDDPTDSPGDGPDDEPTDAPPLDSPDNA
jgi:hypothetical protein